MVKRSRGSATPSAIDRDWPHQVALPDDLCTERNFNMIARFCWERGLKHQTRHVQAIWPNGKYETYRLHCFSDAASAAAFLDHFEGLMFDPGRDRENGKVRGVWRRSGAYTRVLDLGPLSVPEILRS